MSFNVFIISFKATFYFILGNHKQNVNNVHHISYIKEKTPSNSKDLDY